MLWRNLARIAVAFLVVVLAVEVYYGYQLYVNRSEDSPTQSENRLAAKTSPPKENDDSPPDDNKSGESEAAPISTSENLELTLIVHRATPDNIVMNSTYLDNPLTNGNPDAVLYATQNWNPGGGNGTYNNHPIGVWYDSGRDKWAVFNQDRDPMPENAAFNILISDNP